LVCARSLVPAGLALTPVYWSDSPAGAAVPCCAGKLHRETRGPPHGSLRATGFINNRPFGHTSHEDRRGRW